MRLVYVVDRRTVIDQATTIAEAIQKNLGDDRLCVSTLRGQLADNRDWVEDPSRPAIVIGTVDMVGSRLLFSGYRSSYRLVGARRKAKLRVAAMTQRIAEFIEDFSPLRALPALVALEQELRQAIRQYNWDRR